MSKESKEAGYLGQAWLVILELVRLFLEAESGRLDETAIKNMLFNMAVSQGFEISTLKRA